MEFKKLSIKAQAALLNKKLSKLSNEQLEDLILFFTKYLEERKKNNEKK